MARVSTAIGVLAAVGAFAGCGSSSPAGPGPGTPPDNARVSADLVAHGPVPPGSGEGYDVAVYAGLEAWSRRSRGVWQLVLRRPGERPRLAPVAPAARPFDVDVGTDGGGRTLVVFSRCSRRSGCAIYALDPAHGTARALTEFSRRGTSVLQPALDGGRLVYVRVDRRGAQIVLGRLGVASPGRTLARLPEATADTVTGLDLQGARIAYTLQFFVESGDISTELWLGGLGEAPRRIGVGSDGEENVPRVLSPSFAGRHLYVGFANRTPYSDRPIGVFVRRDLITGERSAVRTRGRTVAVAADAARPQAPVLYAEDSGAFDNRRQRLATAAAGAFGPLPKLIALAAATGGGNRP